MISGTDLVFAPDFTLSDEEGTPVHLRDLVGKGPILLLFYRGDWCSYCNAQLAGFAGRQEEMEALSVQTLAISVDGEPANGKLKTKLRLPFPVLSDPDHAVIDLYGGIEPAVGRGIAIGKPATYVLDREGRIAWAYVGEDFADRPLVEEVIEQVRRVTPHA